MRRKTNGNHTNFNAIRKLKITLFCLIILACFANAQAAVIYVDAANTGTQSGSSWLTAFSDIQSAVDVANDGDEIWVKSGTYTRTPALSYDNYVVSNLHKNLNFYGGFPADDSSPSWSDRDWANNATIITGNGETGDNWVRGFSLYSGPVVIDGFVITRCAGDAYGGAGIRMASMSGTSTIRNCIIEDNIGLDHCTGGGVQISNAVTATVNLVGCLIAGNTAQQGGGIYVYGKNNVSYPVNIINCTIVGNRATGTTTTDYGGGIYNNNSYIHFRNSIIWGNTTAVASGPGLYETILGATYSSVSYTLIQGGYSGATNLNQDPQYDADYRLTSYSPCVDRGSNSALPSDAEDLDDDGDTDESIPFDLDALERVVDGDGYSSAIVDMGAYEYGTSVALSLRIVRFSFVEGEAAWECALDLSEAQGSDLDVSLTSSDETEITVPSTVTFSAGETTLFFYMTIVDDQEIDDNQYTTISASASGVIGDTSTPIEVIDDETKVLTLNVPPSATEGDGVLDDHGFVHLSGSLSTPTDVYLSSSNETIVEVPEYVTVGANTLNASFWIGVLDNDDLDGTKNVTITGWIPSDDDFNTASGTISVADDEVPPTMYTVNIATSGQGTTNPTAGAHSYAEGSDASITAIPASGWRFDNWSGDASGTANPVSVTIDGTKTVTANFSEIPPNYDLTLNVEGSGSVSYNPTGLTYESGTTVHLEAIPDEEYVFEEWRGDVADTDSATTSILMDADQTVTAVFLADDDSDGVPTESECGPDGTDATYDGDNSGDPDSEENNVASGHTYNDAYYVTLAVPDTQSLSDVSTTGNPSTSNAPDNVTFPYGFFEFTITGVGAGGSTTATIYLPEGETPTTYWKYGPTPLQNAPHWYEFIYDGSTGAEFNDNVITLHFVDGERGDDDLDGTNGVVVDIGAPGDENAGFRLFDGSSDGGCFIDTLLR